MKIPKIYSQIILRKIREMKMVDLLENHNVSCVHENFSRQIISEKNSISRENAQKYFFDHKIQHPIWATFPSNSGDSNEISVIA